MTELRKRWGGWLFAIGFIAGIVISGIALHRTFDLLSGFVTENRGSVTQIIDGLNGTSLSEQNQRFALALQTHVIRVTLLSSGVLVGTALGGLGLSLFLLGVKGSMEIEGEAADRRLRVLNLAPGSFVILTGAVLVGICCTRPFGVELRSSASANGQSSSESLSVFNSQLATDPFSTLLNNIQTAANDYVARADRENLIYALGLFIAEPDSEAPDDVRRVQDALLEIQRALESDEQIPTDIVRRFFETGRNKRWILQTEDQQ